MLEYTWRDTMAVLNQRQEKIERDRQRAVADKALRDHFAAAALTGLLVHANDGIDEETMDTPSDIAYTAYQMADAMLRERGNQPERPDSSTPDADSRVWETQGHQRPTLTDAEREALEWCVSRPQTHWQHGIYAATLRGLLERTQTVGQ